MKEKMKRESKRVFVDMDGVLCECRPEAGPEDRIKQGFFSSLEPRSGTLGAVRELIRSGEYSVYVLSALMTGNRRQSEEEKNGWLDRFLPELGPERRIYAESGLGKAEAAGGVTGNDILLDDHTPNLEAWVTAGGKAVKVLNGMNGRGGTFTKGPRAKIDSSAELAEALDNA